ncbi:MAG TPA: CBS domain-containing protein [Polyangia bacterium]|nr:CBS domain-containing protein [Polyangia bacterium]
MSVHVVGLSRPAEIRLSAEVPFRGVSEMRAALFGAGPADETHFAAAHVDCQRGGEKSGRSCLDCPRLVDWQPTRPGELAVRCQWTHHDPVRARMTCAGALITIEADAFCVDALETAARAGVHRLLVLKKGALVGMACGCDLRSGATAGATVAEVMAAEVFAIGSGASLGEAAAAMSALGVGALPVVCGPWLVGLITRGDLARAGAPI